MKIQIIFVVICLLIFGCAEKEEPQTIFGDYLAQSIVAERALDMTGEGVASTDLLDQLRTSGEIIDQSTGIIFMRMFSPEYFNKPFSQLTLQLPYHLESQNNINIDYHYDGRRFDLEEGGTLGLSFNTFPSEFDNPQQFQENIVIESLKTIPGENSAFELVVLQRLFDHSVNEWVEVNIAYNFIKENS